MHPAALLALLTIALLAFAALRLELDFRRTCKADLRPEPSASGPERRAPAPELRAAPAGGYWQAPFPRAPQARRAGFA
ncbi:MAG TPA: hypothetical protein VE053_03700 [Allosphingosinicella sp.]|nr:hypothetical protein [Allosphingosinicella sp.]